MYTPAQHSILFPREQDSCITKWNAQKIGNTYRVRNDSWLMMWRVVLQTMFLFRWARDTLLVTVVVPLVRLKKKELCLSPTQVDSTPTVLSLIPRLSLLGNEAKLYYCCFIEIMWCPTLEGELKNSCHVVYLRWSWNIENYIVVTLSEWDFSRAH